MSSFHPEIWLKMLVKNVITRKLQNKKTTITILSAFDVVTEYIVSKTLKT